MRRPHLFTSCLALVLSGCMDQPVSLDQHAEEYEALALYVASEVKPGQIVNYDDAQGTLTQLMADLDVRRVRHERDGRFVLLSGKSSILTGQYSYLYRLGDEQNDLVASSNDEVEREHLLGRWYSEKRYFD
jgi:uncharacterized protein YjiK